jgi:heme exporter protein A
LHFVGHLDGVKGALSAAENLAFVRRLAGSGGKDVAAALTELGLAPLASFPARELSAGQRRRLALARLLVAPRSLWLVDEPTAALDEEGQATFQALAEAHLSGGGMLVAATHAPLRFSNSRGIRLDGDQR